VFLIHLERFELVASPDVSRTNIYRRNRGLDYDDDEAESRLHVSWPR